jgi:hypothetical protein
MPLGLLLAQGNSREGSVSASLVEHGLEGTGGGLEVVDRRGGETEAQVRLGFFGGVPLLPG